MADWDDDARSLADIDIDSWIGPPPPAWQQNQTVRFAAEMLRQMRRSGSGVRLLPFFHRVFEVDEI